MPPALATRVDRVPGGGDWVHEPKIDGYRIQCHVDGDRAVLFSRKGLDWSHRFPNVAPAAVALLNGRDAVLDGEIVVPAGSGESPFQSLQAALSAGPVRNAIYWVFDLLIDGGDDLRGRPFHERRARLAALVGRSTKLAIIRTTPALRERPESLLAAACQRGEEGVISKRRDATYHGGRSRDWLKIKCQNRDELVVIGYTEPEGSRAHFGALLLATRPQAGAALRYAGAVGSGFTETMLRVLHEALRTIERETPCVPVPAAVARRARWVEPRIVADVAFAEWTTDHLLRQATFLGIREDKEVSDVRKETADTVAGVKISSGDRVVYPELKLTKRQLADYMESVAPLMLPHVDDRPISTMRCPDGAHGECFFQKHWPSARNMSVRTVRLAETTAKESDYAVAHQASDLVALVQMNVLEFHVWGSRAEYLESPDRVILDLDPGPGISWKALRESAVRVRELLQGAGLASWVKLSGGKGVHVTVPLERRITWEQCSGFAKLVAHRLVADSPTTFVDVAAKDRRNRRIFVDWMRNSRGATAVAPWSMRARKHAPVAVPLDWSDLTAIEGPAVMTVPVVMDFLQSKPADPWATMRTTRQRLTVKVLDALGDSPGSPASPARRTASQRSGHRARLA